MERPRRCADVTDLRATVARRVAAADRFTDVYRSYCWPVAGVADLRLAPFQVLAAEGQVLIGRGHDWHMAVAARVADVSQPWVATPHVTVDLADADARARAVTWWEQLTAAGGEGMVVSHCGPSRATVVAVCCSRVSSAAVATTCGLRT